MRLIGTTALAVLLALCLACPARANDVRFFVGNLPPYSLVEGHTPKGLAVELMQTMMQSIGEPFDPGKIDVTNWARAVHEVEGTPHSAMLILAKLPERADRFKWVGPIDETELGAFARKDSGVVVKKASDLLKYKVGVVRNTAPMVILLGVLPEVRDNLVLLSSIPTQLRMLRERRVDVIVQASDAVWDMMGSEGMVKEDYDEIHSFATMNLYFGFNLENDDDLIARLQKALDRLKVKDADGTSPYSRMKEKHFSMQGNGTAPLHE